MWIVIRTARKIGHIYDNQNIYVGVQENPHAWDQTQHCLSVNVWSETVNNWPIGHFVFQNRRIVCCIWNLTQRSAWSSKRYVFGFYCECGFYTAHTVTKVDFLMRSDSKMELENFVEILLGFNYKKILLLVKIESWSLFHPKNSLLSQYAMVRLHILV